MYEPNRRVLRGSPLLIVEGEVQRQDGVVNVILQRALPLAG